MGFLLKIILFGVAIYAAWKTFHRWKALYDKFVGKPGEPPRREPPAPAPQPPSVLPRRTAAIEDTHQCGRCGAYIPASAEKCSQCGNPLPQGRSPT